MNRSLLSLSLFAAFGACLVACGGGSSAPAAPAAAAAATVVAPTLLSECFILTPGVKYVRTDGRKNLIVQETFEGQNAFGDVELRANDTRFGAAYQVINGTTLQLLGLVDYDGAGAYSSKAVYSASAAISLTSAVGASIALSYTNTKTLTTPPSVTTSTESTTVTYVGTETLSLGGRTFANACKISVPTGGAGQKRVSWYAKGFGAIRTETQDAGSTTVPGTRSELATIVTAP